MSDDRPSPKYSKYAFANPYNYAVIGGFASAALLTGNWWLGLAGAGAEALWMLFAPDSRLLRKLWFDKVAEQERAAARAAELETKLQALPQAIAFRCLGLKHKQDQINELAKGNPTFTVDLLSSELKKLDDLVRAFIELSVSCARYTDYIKSVDINQIEQDIRRYQQTLDARPGEAKGDGEQRTLAQKNLAVLSKRKEKVAEIVGYLASAKGQLDLIENSFRLLADQIVTMRSPQELSGQLDELLDGVEAVRETARDTDRLLQTIEQ